ncbi:MAG: histone deacetylase [Nitrososphaerota archaeon]|nr:histone deacetylase [Candidatus Bathyarchaeota archaeon]MDW8023403.1 histone deacetylase [Nitrososphaerota archaeon]
MTGKVALIYQRKLLEHDFGPEHPFRKERFTLYFDKLKEKGILDLPQLQVVDPPLEATEEDVLLVHEPSLLNLIKTLSKTGGRLDADTPVPMGTYERALVQAGGIIYAGRAVVKGEFNRAIQCVAFGGHHATRAHYGFSFGFCYFNDDSIVIRHLQKHGYIKRAFILDCDAHHGNGIQEIFYEDPTVVYMSMHQDPRTLYPGTGYIHEVGSGAGEGYTVNVPLPPGVDNENYLRALREVFPPIMREFKPDILLFIAGADNYFADPLTNYNLTMAFYPELTREVLKTADEVCGGKVLIRLGGGYNVKAAVHAFYLVTACAVGAEKLDVNDIAPPPAEKAEPWITKRVDTTLAELKRTLSKYWKCFR